MLQIARSLFVLLKDQRHSMNYLIQLVLLRKVRSCLILRNFVSMKIFFWFSLEFNWRDCSCFLRNDHLLRFLVETVESLFDVVLVGLSVLVGLRQFFAGLFAVVVMAWI